MPVIPASWRLRQENCLETAGASERPCLRKYKNLFPAPTWRAAYNCLSFQFQGFWHPHDIHAGKIPTHIKKKIKKKKGGYCLRCVAWTSPTFRSRLSRSQCSENPGILLSLKIKEIKTVSKGASRSLWRAQRWMQIHQLRITSWKGRVRFNHWHHKRTTQSFLHWTWSLMLF